MVLVKLKRCKTCNNFIFHSLVLCERLGKNLLGNLNLNIYLMSWISLSTKPHGLSLNKKSLQVTLLKKVQTPKESSSQNLTETINNLLVVISSNCRKLQSWKKLKHTILGCSQLFCQTKGNFSFLPSLCVSIRQTRFHIIYVLWVLTFPHGFNSLSLRFCINWPVPQQVKPWSFLG